jgi:glycosyltransferase involved in cell wall biosynthesis
MLLRLTEQLREDGHPVVPVTFVGGVGWLGARLEEIGFAPELVRISDRWIDTVFLKDLVRVIRRHAIEVVHSHEFDMAVYGAAACRLAGIPHVITMHGGLTVWKAWQRRIALRWAMRNSAATVVVSEATRAQFSRELGVSASMFEVVPNGVPRNNGTPAAVRREFNCGADDVVLLAVGNLERNKGHRELLEAVRRLAQESDMPGWKLIIAGGRGGPEHQFLLDFIREHDLAERVHIALSRSDIADLQALADIFVMPSLWEGMPMAVLEAMVAGTPIVASRTGGIPEAVRDEEQGVLVPPGDVAALVQALRPLIREPGYRQALGAAARQRGLAEFTVQAMASRYESIYHRILKERRGTFRRRRSALGGARPSADLGAPALRRPAE